MSLTFDSSKIIKRANPLLVELGIHTTDFRHDYNEYSRLFVDLQKRKEYDKLYEELSAFCLKDLFAFGYFILNLPADDPFIIARFYEMQDQHDMTIDLWAREHWKAVDLNEPVITPSGWKAHGDLIPGDFVYGGDGFPVKVIAKTKIFYNAPCYKIKFDDGYSVVVSNNHLWTVEKVTRKRDYYKRKYRETVVMSTDEIYSHGCESNNRLATWIVPIEFEAKKLDIPPYILGAWLGDGASENGSVTNEDAEVWENINKSGFEYSMGRPSNDITKTIYKLQPLLRKYNLLKNKHIPKDYLFSSFDDRLELLRGLMDTDGTVDSRGTATFTNISEKLIDCVFDLCVSLGLKPRKRKHVNKKGLNEKYTFYNISFQAYKKNCPFTIKRKIEKCKNGERVARRFIVDIKKVASVPVSCIQVDGDGTYLVGKHLAVTHNSTVGSYALPIWRAIRNPENRCVFFCFNSNLSKALLRRVKVTLESNDLVRMCYPDQLYMNPKKESNKWSERDGLNIKRKGAYTECTFEGYGLIDKMPVGRHYTERIYDDIVDPQTVANPENIRKAEEVFKHSDNLGARGGIKRVIATRYKYNDPYSRILENGRWTSRIYPAEVDEYGNAKRGGTPIYMTESELDAKFLEQGEDIFYCQMLQKPMHGKLSNFRESYKRLYDKLPNGHLNYYIVVDSAKFKRGHVAGRQERTDYTVMWAFAVDALRNWYMLDGVRDKLDLLQKWTALRNLSQRWGIKRIGYEQYGMMTDAQFMDLQQRDEGLFLEIVELRGLNQDERIPQLIPYYKQGKIWWPENGIWYEDVDGNTINLVDVFFDEEFYDWPSSKHDDMLSAHAWMLSPKLDVVFPDISIGDRPKEKYVQDPLELDKDMTEEEAYDWLLL